MLGKTVRWLRLLGEDVTYMKDLSDKSLIEKAIKEKRILLTSDEDLFKAALSKNVEARLIEKGPIYSQIGLLAKEYGIPLEFNPKKSRCPRCNEPLRKVLKNEVEDHVPPHSYQRYTDYWVCSNKKCKKIYWRGSHWKNISETLKMCIKTVSHNNGKSESKLERGRKPRKAS